MFIDIVLFVLNIVLSVSNYEHGNHSIAMFNMFAAGAVFTPLAVKIFNLANTNRSAQ